MSKPQSCTEEVMRHVDELVWILEDTPDFIAGRIVASMLRYRELSHRSIKH